MRVRQTTFVTDLRVTLLKIRKPLRFYAGALTFFSPPLKFGKKSVGVVPYYIGELLCGDALYFRHIRRYFGKQFGNESGESGVGVGIAVRKHGQEIAEVLMESKGNHTGDKEEEYGEELEVSTEDCASA